MVKTNTKTGYKSGRQIILLAFLVVMSVSILGSLKFNQQTAFAVPTTINFQARLMNAAGSIAPDGDYNVEFKIYKASTSSGSSQGSCTGDANCLWTETRTSSDRVHVANGYLTADLGSVTGFGSINWGDDLWITMRVGGNGGSPSWDTEMSPRLKLTAVPYAFSTSQLAGGSGANTTVLDGGTPSGNNVLHLPAESGTLCVQNSNNCGFLTTGGGGGGNFIVNGTSLQSNANFNFQSGASGSVGGAIRGAASQTANLFQLQDSSGNVNAAFSANGSQLTLGRIATSGAVTAGSLLFGDGTTSGYSMTLDSETLTASRGISFPDEDGIVCLRNSNNCGFAVTGGSGFIQLAPASAQVDSSTNNSIFINKTGASGAIARWQNNGTDKFIIANNGNLGLSTSTANNLLTINAAATADSAATALVSTGGTSNKALVLQGVASQGADLLQLQDSSGNVNAAFSADGAQLTLGRVASSGTVTAGVLRFSDGTTDNYTVSIDSNTLTGNRSIHLPDEDGIVCLRNSNNCGFATTGGSGSFIQNGTTTQFNANFNIQTTNAASVVGVIGGVASQTADLFQLQDNNGNVNSSFSAAGNQLTLGRISNSGTVTQGKIVLSDGTTSNFGTTLQSANLTSGSQVITIPDTAGVGGTICLQNSAACGFAATSGGSGYIQNQSASAQPGNFFIQSSAAGSIGAVIQAASGQTANMFEIRNAGGTPVVTVSATSGTLFAGIVNTNGLNVGASTATAKVAILPGSTSNVGLAVQAMSGQTADLFQLQDSSNNATTSFDASGYLHFNRAAASSSNVLSARVAGDTNDRFTIAADGSLKFGPGNATTDVTLQRGSANTLTTGNLALGVTSPYNSRLSVLAVGSAFSAAVLRGASGQTADLLQLQDNSGNVNSAFSGLGNQLTLGRISATGTVTQGKLVLSDGTTDNFGVTLQSSTLTANNTITLPNESGTLCVQASANCGFALSAGSGNYIQQIPATTAANTIAPTANSVVALTVKGTTGTTARVLEIYSSNATPTLQAYFDTAGSLNVSQLIQPTANNTIDLGTSGTAFRTGYFGTSVVSSSFTGAGAVGVDAGGSQTLSLGTGSGTSAISVGKTGQTTTVNGALTATQLLTGNAGLTASGAAVALNASSNFATNINTGTSMGAVSIGNSLAGALSLQSSTTISIATTNFNVSVGGVVSAATGYQIGGAAAAGNFLRGNGTNFVSSGIQSSDIPLCTGTCNYISNQTSQQASANFNISGTGTAATLQAATIDTPAGTTTLNIGTTNATAGITLAQNTTVASGKTLTVTSGATSLTGATSGDALSVNNSTSTGNIAVFKDNGTAVVTIADGGGVGIGTGTPGAFKLNVQGGNANFSGVVYLDRMEAASGFHIGEGVWDSTKLLYVYKSATITGDNYAVFGHRYTNNVNNPSGKNIGTFGKSEGWNLGAGNTLGWSMGVLALGDGTSGDGTNNGTVTNAAGVYVQTGTRPSQNRYGLYLENMNQGTSTNYAIYSAGGNSYFAGNLQSGSLVQGVTGSFTGANALTLGTTGTSTGAVLFKGATAASGTLTVIGPANPTANTLTLPNETGTLCSTGSICSGYAAAAGSGSYIQQIPATTGANTIAPTAASVVALTVKGTTGTAARVLEIYSSNASPALQAYFDANGSLNVSQLIQPTVNNTIDLGTSGAAFRTGYFGTSVVSPSFTGSGAVSVDTGGSQTLSLGTGNASAISVGKTGQTTTVNGALTATQLLTANGGFTALGTVSINASGSASTSIGNASSAFSLTSTGISVTSAGAVSGVTTLATSSTINSQTISAASNFTGTVTIQGASALTLGTTGTSNGAVLFKGSTAASGTITLVSPTNPTNNTLTLPNETGALCSTGSVCSGYAAAAGTGNYIQQVPAATAANTIAPTVNSVVSLTVKGTTGTAARVLEIYNSNAVPTLQAYFDANGSLNVSQIIQPTSSNTVDLGTSSVAFRTGYFGTSVISPLFTGTGAVGVDTGGSQTLSLGTGNASAISVGKTGQTTTVNGALTATQLLTGNGGLTVTGTTGINTSGTANTSIGNASGTFALVSNGLNVTSAGALSGITGYTQTSGNFSQSGAGTFGTGTGAVSLNGDTTVAANKNLTLASGTGLLGQTYSNTTGTAATFGITDSSTSGTTTVQGVAINLTGTATSGTNTITGLNFGNVSAATNNTFNGINFGTGFAALLQYNGTTLINGSGILQNNAISTGVNYSNLTQVGTLTSGALGSGFTTVAVGQGGTGATTFTSNGIIYGNGTGALQATAAGTTGQCLLGNTGTAPTWGTCATGTVTLQTAYNNSTNPELTLDATRGALTIRDNSTPLGANLLEVQSNGGGTTYLAVSATGISVTGTIAGSSTITGTTLNGTTGINTGASAGTQRIDSSGNLVNIGTVSAGTYNSQTISSAANFTGTATIQGANALTLGTTGTNTGAILFKGSTAASGTLTLIGQANPSNNTLTLPNETGTLCSTGSICSGYAAAAGTGNYLQQVPTSNTPGATGANVIAPTAASIVGLTVKGTTGTAARVLEIYNSSATPSLQAYFDASGSLNVGQVIQPTANNTIDLGLSGTAFRTGYFGTSVVTPSVVTNGATALGLNTGSAAAINIGTTNANAINIGNATNNPNIGFTGSGTFGTTSGAISLNGNTTVTGTKTFSVTNALSTLTGGLTTTGTAQINASSNNNTSINTGSSTGTVGIGNGAAGAITIQSGSTIALTGTNFSVTTGGVVNALTGFRIAGAAANGNFLRGDGTNFVSSGIQSGDIPACSGSCNYISNQTGQQASSNFNISGTGVAGVAMQAPLFQTADATGTSAGITLRSGNSTTSGNSGTVTIASGNATSGNSGNVSIDSGTASGTKGDVNIGNTSANAVSIGRTGQVTTVNGSLTTTQLLTSNGGITIAANQSLNMSSGSGVLGQTFINSSASSALTQSVTNSNSGGSSVAINAHDITLVGTATSGGVNSSSALRFANPSAATNNNFYGLNFAGTGYTDILRVGSNQIIDGSGKLQDTGISSSVTYSNLQKVGTINTGTWNGTTVGVAYGGTGQTTYTDGQLLIGNSTGNTLTKATLTGTTNRLTVANGGGSITLNVDTNQFPSSAGANTVLKSTGVGTAAWVANTQTNICSDCATTSLNNLSSVAINTSLLSGLATVDLGSNANPFRDLYLGGTATNNFRFTGTASGGAKTITLDNLSGNLALVQTAGSSTAQTGDLNVNGTLIAGTALQGTLVKSADTTGTSSGMTLRSGNSTSSGDTGSVTIASGAATSGNSGNVSIDAGTASATKGTVSIGTGQASQVNVSKTGFLTNIQGAATVAELLTANGNVDFADGAAGDIIEIGDSLTSTQDTVTLNGDLNFGTDTDADTIVLGSTGNADTFSLNSSGLRISTTGNLTNVGTDITGAAAVTLASGSSSALTLDSASNTLSIAASDTTLQRNASGTYTIDLLNAAGATTLSVANSNGSQVANLMVEGSITATGATFSGLSSGVVYAASGVLNSEANLSVIRGGTGIGTTTAYGLLTGGTTATGAFQNAGTGTAGQVLVSAGAGALPTWVDASGAGVCTDCIIRVPTATATNTIAPTTASVVALTVKGTTGSSSNVLEVHNAGGSPALQAYFDSAGALNVSQGIKSTTNNTLDLGASANAFRSGYFGTSVTSLTFQGFDTTGASSTVALRSGNSTTSGNTGDLNMSTGAAASGNSGNISIDTGTASGTRGTISIGTTNASSITIGKSATSVNVAGNLSVAANQNVSLASGTGTLTQTYVSNSGPATSFSITDNSASGTTNMQGVAINLTGTATSGTNTITGLNFGSVSAAANNTFNGINFGTGFSNLLQYNGNTIISGLGIIQPSFVTGSYTGITGVGTLTAGTWNGTTIGTAYGGTGQTTYTDGQLLIGNSSGNGLTKATLTGTANRLGVTNGNGSITLNVDANQFPSSTTSNYILKSGSTGTANWVANTQANICSDCANTALSNLGTTAINLSLLAGTGNAIDLGASGTAFRSGFFGTSVVTPSLSTNGATPLNINTGTAAAINIGTSTANAISLGNASSTFAVDSNTIDITTLGAVSGVTTLSTSGIITVGTLGGSTGAANICRNSSNQISTCSGANGSDATATLQNAYTNSTISPTPEILLDGTRRGLDIQDANTTIGATESLFAVRGSASATTLGVAYFSVNASGKVGINLGSSSNSATPTTTYDLSFGNAAARTIGIEPQTASNTIGGALTVRAGNGLGTGAGALLSLLGGSGSTGNAAGGGVTIQAGAAASTSTGGVGGNIIIQGGASAGSAANNGGTITIYGGAASGAGTAGNINLATSGGTTTVGRVNIGFAAQGTAAAAFGGSDSNASTTLAVRDVLEVVNSNPGSTVSQLLFTNTSGTGDFRMGSGGGDLYWQGGGGRALQVGAYWQTIITGRRGTSTLPTFVNGTAGTSVIIESSATSDIALQVRGVSTSQSVNLFQVQKFAGDPQVLTIGADGSLTSTPNAVGGTIQLGSTTQTGNMIFGQSTASNTISIGNNTTATGNTQTINIGSSATGTGKAAITIGNTNAASSLLLQAGTGDLKLLASGGDIIIGTADTVGTLLILDTKTDAGDPTGVAGGMYYNSNMNQMRCYFGGKWRLCNDTASLEYGYNISEDFNVYHDDNIWGAYGWIPVLNGSTGTIASVAPDSPSRPGQMQLSYTNSASSTSGMYLGFGNANSAAGFYLGGGEEIKMAVNLPAVPDATNNYIMRIGLCDSQIGNCSNGAYFEIDRTGSTTAWRIGASAGGSSTEANSTGTLASTASGWHRFKIVANANASTLTYYIDDVSVGTIGATIPNTSANTTEGSFMISRVAGAARSMKVDYFQMTNGSATAR